MIVLHVAEPQRLWLSLQHTPPSAGIAGSPVEVVAASAGVAGSPAEVVGTLAETDGILEDVADSIAVALAEVKKQQQFSFHGLGMHTCCVYRRVHCLAMCTTTCAM